MSLRSVAFAILAGYISLLHADSSRLINRSTRTTVTVTVIWMKTYEEIEGICLEGQPPVLGRQIVGCFVEKGESNTIYAVEPDNFLDAERLTILGHEFWHALGANHT